MRTRIGLVAVLALSIVGSVHADTPPSSNDERIKQLEQRVAELEGKKPATTQDAVEQSRQDALKDLEAKEPPPPTQRTPVSFNPDIAVVTDFRGSISTDNANPARNRFDIGSVELDLRAAIAPSADGVAVLPFVRGVEDPLFFDPATASGEVSTGTEIEEAYVFLHDFGVQNLTAKLGRYHLRFGRQNILHSHDWPTFDNNFVNQSFLGEEALSDAGLSLSYVIPPKLIGDQYIEAILEINSGEGEGPVVNNSAFVDSPAVDAHLLWNHDLNKEWNIELGTSFLFAHHNDDNQDNVFLYGGDVTLIHTDPSGRFNNQLFQAEAIYGNVDTDPTTTQHSFGAYALAQQQLHRDWYVGARADWTENALDEHQEVWGISPYVTWYYTEFLRFRLEYQYKAGDTPTENNLYFQVTWIIGAHPPHPYWAMR